MEFAELMKRAVALRRRYQEIEQATAGRSWTNAELMQGFVGDVGDLMKLVMAKDGLREAKDVDRKLAHELADCLWSVLVLAHAYGIDLERELLQTIEALDESIAIQLSHAGGRLPGPRER